MSPETIGWVILLACTPVLLLPLVVAATGALDAPARAAAAAIDRVNGAVGHTVAWFALFMVLVQLAVVILRYVFGVGIIWMQESIVYMHALLFMLAAAYTLLKDGHVRVDIFYREAPPKRKAAVDFIGSYVLLAPVAVLILIVAMPYVGSSWSVMEGSREASGIQGVWLLKTAIPLFAVMMLLQAASQAAKAALVLRGLPGTGTGRPRELHL